MRARDTRASCDVIILRLTRSRAYVNQTVAHASQISDPSIAIFLFLEMRSKEQSKSKEWRIFRWRFLFEFLREISKCILLNGGNRKRGIFLNFQFLDRHIFSRNTFERMRKLEDTSMEISFRIFARNFQMHSF